MKGKVRHQLFLTPELSERLHALASRPGVSRSALLERAVADWLDRKDVSELDARFGPRLDRMAVQLERLSRDTHIELETLALFVRYELAIHPPLGEADSAGRAAGAARFEAFLNQVARKVASGARTLEKGQGQ